METIGNKVAVVGSRSFTDYSLLVRTLSSFHSSKGISLIVSGGAAGADSMAERFAKENNIQTSIHKPDWKKYGRAAGFIRNKDIIAECDVCFAFWDGSSRGTANDIELCNKMNKPCYIINF